MTWLLNEQGVLAKPVKPELERQNYDLSPKPPHYAPKARAMISLFMQGGPSQMDLMDPKPKLAQYAGKKFPGKIKYDNAAQASAKVLPSNSGQYAAYAGTGDLWIESADDWIALASRVQASVRP